MRSATRMYWLHALTPVHVGAGRGVRFIDLPVMREKVTRWPVIPGSAVKGVLRDHFATTADPSLHRRAFGEAGNDGHAGALVFTDARLVAMPVRSLFGTFAYVTSRLSLLRLARDLIEGDSAPPPEPPPGGTAVLLHSSPTQLRDPESDMVYLEDLDFKGENSAAAQSWAEYLAGRLFANDPRWQAVFKERFAIVPDDAFDFLAETGTEVNARVRIDDQRKTVADGHLWYEESLPAETLLAGLVYCDRVPGEPVLTAEQLLKEFCDKPIQCQIGGKASIGKGRVRCLFTREG